MTLAIAFDTQMLLGNLSGHIQYVGLHQNQQEQSQNSGNVF